MGEYLEEFGEQVREHFWYNWDAIREVCEPVLIYHDIPPYHNVLVPSRKVSRIEEIVSTFFVGATYAIFAIGVTSIQTPYLIRETLNQTHNDSEESESFL